MPAKCRTKFSAGGYRQCRCAFALPHVICKLTGNGEINANLRNDQHNDGIIEIINASNLSREWQEAQPACTLFGCIIVSQKL